MKFERLGKRAARIGAALFLLVSPDHSRTLIHPRAGASRAPASVEHAFRADDVTIRSDRSVWAIVRAPITPDDADRWRNELTETFSPGAVPSAQGVIFGRDRVLIRLDDALPVWFTRNLGKPSPIESNCKAVAYALVGLAPRPWAYDQMTAIGPTESFVFQNEWVGTGRITLRKPNFADLAIGDFVYYPTETDPRIPGSDHLVTYLGHGLIAENNAFDYPQTNLISILSPELSLIHTPGSTPDHFAPRPANSRRLYRNPSLVVSRLKTGPAEGARSDDPLFRAADLALSARMETGGPVNSLAPESFAPAESLRRACKLRWLAVKRGESPYVPGESERDLDCETTLEKFKGLGGYR